MNYGHAMLLRAKLEDRDHPPSDRLGVAVAYARELLNAGKIDQALLMFRSIEDQLKTRAPALWAKVGSALLYI